MEQIKIEQTRNKDKGMECGGEGEKNRFLFYTDQILIINKFWITTKILRLVLDINTIGTLHWKADIFTYLSVWLFHYYHYHVIFEAVPI